MSESRAKVSEKCGIIYGRRLKMKFLTFNFVISLSLFKKISGISANGVLKDFTICINKSNRQQQLSQF